jgi:AmiR/NasT family two-component response regulator
MADLRQATDRDMTNLRLALESRDLIGQAKGVIMVTMRCSPDRAFELLVAQSQAENRKLVEVAAEIASRASRAAQSD